MKSKIITSPELNSSIVIYSLKMKHNTSKSQYVKINNVFYKIKELG